MSFCQSYFVWYFPCCFVLFCFGDCSDAIWFPFSFQFNVISSTKRSFWLYEMLRHLLVFISCFKSRKIKKSFFFFFPHFKLLKPYEKKAYLKLHLKYIILLLDFNYQCALEINSKKEDLQLTVLLKLQYLLTQILSTQRI